MRKIARLSADERKALTKMGKGHKPRSYQLANEVHIRAKQRHFSRSNY